MVLAKILSPLHIHTNTELKTRLFIFLFLGSMKNLHLFRINTIYLELIQSHLFRINTLTFIILLYIHQDSHKPEDCLTPIEYTLDMICLW